MLTPIVEHDSTRILGFIQGASVNRAILQHCFFWFGNTGADAAIAILLPTLKRLIAMEPWTGAQRALAVKAFYKNSDSFVIVQRSQNCHRCNSVAKSPDSLTHPV